MGELLYSFLQISVLPAMDAFIGQTSAKAIQSVVNGFGCCGVGWVRAFCIEYPGMSVKSARSRCNGELNLR